MLPGKEFATHILYDGDHRAEVEVGPAGERMGQVPSHIGRRRWFPKRWLVAAACDTTSSTL